MGRFSEYPYSDFSELNLDYVFKKLSEMDERLKDYVKQSTITFHDPITWDITDQYTINTMVIDRDGTAYLSVKPVPAGVDISNTEYWQPIFNYDDNINQLRATIAANERNRTTASAPRNVGDLVYLNGDIYKVTAEMAAGSAYIIDTNCIKYTVSDRIKDLLDSILENKDDIEQEKTDRENADIEIESKIEKYGVFVSVKYYGAVGDGVHDDTQAIQNCINENKNVSFPAGTYLVSGTISVPLGRHIKGGNANDTIILRSDNYVGNTFDVVGACVIEGLWFRRNLNKTTNTILNPVNAESSHISITNGQLIWIEKCMFWNMPIGIDIKSTSIAWINNNNFTGSIYDPVVAGLQEAVAAIRIGHDSYCQLINIIGNYIGGGYLSAERNVTVGSGTVSIQQNIGPRYGIFVECCEGINIARNYIGGFSDYGICLNPMQILVNVKIHNNFLDGNFRGGIGIISATENTVNGIMITENGFNGQLSSIYGIFVPAVSGTKAVQRMTVSNNVFENYLGAGICLFGVSGVTILGNEITSYNAKNTNPALPPYNSGVYVGSPSKKVLCVGNAFGGGINDVDISNYCVNGVYFEAVGTGKASDSVDNGISGVLEYNNTYLSDNFNLLNNQVLTSETVIDFRKQTDNTKMTSNGGVVTFNDSGVYQINATVYYSGVNDSVTISVFKGSNRIYTKTLPSVTGAEYASVSVLIAGTQSDTFDVTIKGTSETTVYTANSIMTVTKI